MFSEELPVDVILAAETLDREYYGMENVKKHKLHYIAVNLRKRHTNRTAICLHGPSGVGKTSIAQSFAGILKRNVRLFEGSSVAGVRSIELAPILYKIFEKINRFG